MMNHNMLALFARDRYHVRMQNWDDRGLSRPKPQSLGYASPGTSNLREIPTTKLVQFLAFMLPLVILLILSLVVVHWL